MPNQVSGPYKVTVHSIKNVDSRCAWYVKAKLRDFKKQKTKARKAGQTSSITFNENFFFDRWDPHESVVLSVWKQKLQNVELAKLELQCPSASAYRSCQYELTVELLPSREVRTPGTPTASPGHARGLSRQRSGLELGKAWGEISVTVTFQPGHIRWRQQQQALASPSSSLEIDTDLAPVVVYTEGDTASHSPLLASLSRNSTRVSLSSVPTVSVVDSNLSSSTVSSTSTISLSCDTSGSHLSPNHFPSAPSPASASLCLRSSPRSSNPSPLFLSANGSSMNNSHSFVLSSRSSSNSSFSLLAPQRASSASPLFPPSSPPLASVPSLPPRTTRACSLETSKTAIVFATPPKVTERRYSSNTMNSLSNRRPDLHFSRPSITVSLTAEEKKSPERNSPFWKKVSHISRRVSGVLERKPFESRDVAFSRPPDVAPELPLTLLLLGAGGVGKSTFFKLPTVGSMTDHSRRMYTSIIHNNIILDMKTLCRMSPIYGPVECQASLQKLEQVKEESVLDGTIVHHLEQLWADPGIQTTYRNRARFQVGVNLPAYMERLPYIQSAGYIPTSHDILLSRVPTTGSVESRVELEGVSVRLLDNGGERSERKKWIHLFGNVNAVLFVVNLDGYNKVLYEDESFNRMQEDLDLFEEICNSDFFLDAKMFLFLNKKDLFRTAIEDSRETDPELHHLLLGSLPEVLVSLVVEYTLMGTDPLSDYFPEYKGGPNYDRALAFVQNMFESLSQREDPVVTLPTNFLDIEETNDVLKTVIDSVKLATQQLQQQPPPLLPLLPQKSSPQELESLPQA